MKTFSNHRQNDLHYPDLKYVLRDSLSASLIPANQNPVEIRVCFRITFVGQMVLVFKVWICIGIIHSPIEIIIESSEKYEKQAMQKYPSHFWIGFVTYSLLFYWRKIIINDWLKWLQSPFIWSQSILPTKVKWSPREKSLLYLSKITLDNSFLLSSIFGAKRNKK